MRILGYLPDSLRQKEQCFDLPPLRALMRGERRRPA
jgi:hypothetical protein